MVQELDTLRHGIELRNIGIFAKRSRVILATVSPKVAAVQIARHEQTSRILCSKVRNSFVQITCTNTAPRRTLERFSCDGHRRGLCKGWTLCHLSNVEVRLTECGASFCSGDECCACCLVVFGHDLLVFLYRPTSGYLDAVTDAGILVMTHRARRCGRRNCYRR